MEQPAETESLIGKELGSYHIERKLGSGGMGVVFEATHRQIGQRVAIKLLHNHIARDGKTFQRFENEAKAIGRIKHPGLVNIHGYENTADGVAYIVMEFLQGEALYDRLEKLRAEQKRLPCAQAVSLIRQVAAALSEAHAHGIVHCDLKPENLFLVRDELVEFGERIKILDFGIAKFVSDDGGRKTTVGLVLGTPIYMSPEQCEGRDKISEKADVYSLGVMFYELLAGEVPFRADSSAALMRKHMLLEPAPIATKVQGVPSGVAHALHRMLAKEPDQRPTMRELVAMLEHPDRVADRAQSNGLRNGVLAAGVAVLLLGALGAFAWRGGANRRSPTQASAPRANVEERTPAAKPTVAATATSSRAPDGTAEKGELPQNPTQVVGSPLPGAKKKREKGANRALAAKTTPAPVAEDVDAVKKEQPTAKVIETKAAEPSTSSVQPDTTEPPKKKSYGAFR